MMSKKQHTTKLTVTAFKGGQVRKYKRTLTSPDTSYDWIVGWFTGVVTMLRDMGYTPVTMRMRRDLRDEIEVTYFDEEDLTP